jgi:putative hydrolase of the HAD superfamily
MGGSRPPSTLFLDVGGVLLTNGWDHNIRRSAAEKFGVDYEEMNERHHLTYDTYESGKLSLIEYLDRIVFYEGRDFTREEFKTFMFSQSQPFPEMIELVKALKQKFGLKVGVISNEGRELNEYRIATFRLSDFVDFFVSSCFVHFRKPDRDIYRIALDVAQVSPGESVYIDDRAMFAQVAAGLGLNAICHKAYESTKLSLARLGLAL